MSLFAFDAAACRALADRYGTPMFAYRADLAAASWRQLRQAVPVRVRLAYAVKANPLPELLALFASLGSSFDVASMGELDRVLDCGVAAQRLFFAGPGKKNAEIRRAVRLGVRLQAEGIEDLLRVEEAARLLGLPEVVVNLRVQPLGVEEAGHSKGGILGGSGPTAFGVDEEDLPALLERAKGLERVKIRGLHGFAASNERDAARLLRNHGRMLDIGRAMSQDFGIRLQQIDLGGGLGVPYTAAETPLDVVRLGRGLSNLLKRHPWFRGELVLEPGRFLAAACGVYLVRVVRIKRSRGEHFAILDGGIHHLLRPVLTGEPFPVRAEIPRRCDPEVRRSTILAGPLCTALDRLGTVDLPLLQPGDLLTLGRVGAYGATEAMTRFLDHPRAPEVWVEGGSETLSEGR